MRRLALTSNRSPRWQRAILERTRALARVLPRALEGDVEAIHDARVASRRVRESLSLARRVNDSRTLRKLMRRARRVTRRLGRVRELDVGLALLDAIAASRPAEMGQIQSAKGLLAESRRALVEQ